MIAQMSAKTLSEIIYEAHRLLIEKDPEIRKMKFNDLIDFVGIYAQTEEELMQFVNAINKMGGQP